MRVRQQMLPVLRSAVSTFFSSNAYVTKRYQSLLTSSSLQLMTIPSTENSEKKKRHFNVYSQSSRAVSRLEVQFTGSTLTQQWGRKFILGVLLLSPALSEWLMQQSNSNHTSEQVLTLESNAKADEERRHLTTLLPHLQQVYGESWNMSPLVLDGVSTRNIYKILAQYALGDGMLLDDVLRDLNCVLEAIPFAPQHVEYPPNMLRLLEILKYVAPHDNLHRIRFEGKLRYPVQAEALALPFLEQSQLESSDHADLFDEIREVKSGPAYAIDSATTSEVDDAIGVEEEEYYEEEEQQQKINEINANIDDSSKVIKTDRTKERRRKRKRLVFTVYVSDATAYCPLTSPLEQITARLLCTTTYLPEGVYFMLPRPIIQAATLQEQNKCRTFNIRFSVDEVTGEVVNYSVHVGWLKQLRRLTYEQVQGVLDTTSNSEHCAKEEEGNNNNSSDSSSNKTKKDENEVAEAIHVTRTNTEAQLPEWVTQADVERLKQIYKIAQLRFKTRMERAEKEIREFEQLSEHEHDDEEKCIDHNNSTSSSNNNNKSITDIANKLIDINLPDPYIRVEHCNVITLKDQIIATAEARLLVAELMIAANEVCSRVAQENRLALPYRGTRELSTDHEVSEYDTEPHGVETLSSIDTNYIFFAESMQRSLRRLRGVTRAIYSSTPLFHSGLQTFHYCHATSPLRRYADMLVHYQLKALIMKQHAHQMQCRKATLSRHNVNVESKENRYKESSVSHAINREQGSSGNNNSDSNYKPNQYWHEDAEDEENSVMGECGQHAPLPEYVVASLCANINNRQEESRRLQDNSIFYWQLRYVEQLMEQKRKERNEHTNTDANENRLIFTCLVGETREVHASPAYERFCNSSFTFPYQRSKEQESSEELCSNYKNEYEINCASIRLNEHDYALCNETQCNVPCSGRWAQPVHEYRYVSDLYLPQLQLAHTLLHNTAEVKVGMIVECAVRHVLPSQGVLELEIVHVRRSDDERRYRDLYMGGVVSSLDT